ncbi:MAG: adenylate/guanylate cyclase domain-containing protein [Candidatus Dormiibacterota bacterium]
MEEKGSARSTSGPMRDIWPTAADSPRSALLSSAYDSATTARLQRVTWGLALFGVAAVLLIPQLPGENLVAVRVVAAIGAVVLIAGIVFARFLVGRPWVEAAAVAITYVLLALVVYFLGPSYSPYGAAAYVGWTSAAVLIFERWMVAILLAVVAVCYGAVVLYQPTDVPGAFRWIWLMFLILAVQIVVGLSAETAQRLRVALERGRQEERLTRLSSFLSPAVARAVVDHENEDLLDPHRREIAVVFIDLRNFSRFTSEVEPEEVMAVLGDYLKVSGDVLSRHQATVGQIQGDGIMAYFNDPLPIDDPAGHAAETALELRSRLDDMTDEWRGRGYDLGYGIGISMGYATLGVIGFEGRQEYGPVGTVANLASRLCGRADSGQVLMDQRTFSRIAKHFQAEELAPMEIKGFAQPVAVVSVLGATTGAERREVAT